MAKKKAGTTGALHIMREDRSWCYLSAKKMSLAEYRNDRERNSVSIPYRKCRKQLGLPVVGRVGASLCLAWTVEPASKAKKKAAKRKSTKPVDINRWAPKLKAAKKGRK